MHFSALLKIEIASSGYDHEPGQGSQSQPPHPAGFISWIREKNVVFNGAWYRKFGCGVILVQHRAHGSQCVSLNLKLLKHIGLVACEIFWKLFRYFLSKSLFPNVS